MSKARQELDSLIRRSRGSAAGAPPFSRVWRAAVERQRQRRFRRRLLLASASLSAVVLLVVLLVLAPDSRGPAPRFSDAASSEAVELALSLSDWRAPLDFLLEPPGGGLLGFDLRAAELQIPYDLPTLGFEETL